MSFLLYLLPSFLYSSPTLIYPDPYLSPDLTRNHIHCYPDRHYTRNQVENQNIFLFLPSRLPVNSFIFPSGNSKYRFNTVALALLCSLFYYYKLSTALRHSDCPKDFPSAQYWYRSRIRSLFFTVLLHLTKLRFYFAYCT